MLPSTTGSVPNHKAKEEFAHYTTSEVLENLPNTDFSLVGILELIIKHHMAPKSGELFFGGFLGLFPASKVCLTSLIPEKHYARNKVEISHHDFMVKTYANRENKTVFYEDEVALEKDFPGQSLYESLIKLAIQAQNKKLPSISEKSYKLIEKN